MGEWHKDASGMKFKEISDELLHPTLKQRSKQETRWARADLSAKEAFFRNDPTIYNAYGIEAMKCRAERDITGQKEIEKKMKMLEDPEFWLHLIGFAQILNIIVEASLEAQHEKYFSTSSLYLVNQAMEKIRNLGERFEWETDILEFAGIGSPDFLVTQLKTGENGNGGMFKPVVGEGAKKRRARMINSLRTYRREMSINPEEEEDRIHHTDIVVGEIPVENFEPYKEIRVLAYLQNLCIEVHQSYTERLRPTPLQVAAVEVFHDDFSWFADEEIFGEEEISSDEDESERDNNTDTEVTSRGGGGRSASINIVSPASSPAVQRQQDSGGHRGEDEDDVQSLPSPSHSQSSEPELSSRQKAERMIKKVLDCLPAPVTFDYTVEALTQGFLLFIRTKKSKDWDSLEDSYAEFHRVYEQDSRAKQFIFFFEKIQIKSNSEAIAESIGSIMKISLGRNRNLEPINFSKEIFLCVNLPPLHILKLNFIPEIVAKFRRRKSFFRNDQYKSYVAKFKYADSSSSLGNFRSSEEKRCRLPLDFFK